MKHWRGLARPRLGLMYGCASTGCPILTERSCSSATSKSLTPNKRRRHLGIAPGAVKTRLHRARQALRTLLDPLVLGP